MNIRNCSLCGGVYHALSTSDLCQSCMKQVNEIYQYVEQKYAEQRQGMTLEAVASTFEISPEHLRRLVGTGRLGRLAESVVLTCKKCGATVTEQQRAGQFCRPCAESIARETRVVQKSYELQKEKLKPIVAKRSRHEAERYEAAKERPQPERLPDSATMVDFEGEGIRRQHVDDLPPPPPAPPGESFGFKRSSD